MHNSSEYIERTAPLPPVSTMDETVRTLLLLGAMAPPENPGLLGNLGRFEILCKIGEGGMGIVFLARDPDHGQQRVAIKVLRPQLAGDAQAIHQFLKEPRHMEQLAKKHPHIMPVREICDQATGPYYVMPYLPGGSLANLIRPDRPLAPDRILDLCLPLAGALAYAHKCGIIHRDLKPANILLDETGKPYLSDFGLVRTVFNDSMVRIGQPECTGTLPYMSPAVAAGEAEDTRCDIYSFGAMVYEMLTGYPPYQGNSRNEVRQKILAGPPSPIIALNSKAHPGLVKIVEKAMARNLRDRYASMGDLKNDLAGLRKEAGGSWWDAVRFNFFTNRRKVAVAGAILVAGLVLATVWGMRHSPRQMKPERPLLTVGENPRTKSEPSPPAAASDSAGENVTGLSVDRYLPLGKGLNGICLSPDLTRLYAAFGENEQGSPLDIIDLKTGGKIDSFSYGNRHCHSDVVRSPDGRFLYTLHYYYTYMSRLDLQTKEETQLELGGVKYAVWAGDIDLAPNGELIAVALGRDGRNYDMKNDQISIISIRNGEFLLAGEVRLDDEPSGHKMGFSADSRRLYVVTMPRQTSAARLYEIALTTPYQILRRLDFQGGMLRGIAVAPADGRIYVSDMLARKIWLVNPSTWIADSAFELDGATPGCLLLSPDGKILYVIAEAIRAIFVMDAGSGKILGRLTGLGKDMGDMELSPDGRWLYVANGGEDSRVAIVKIDPQSWRLPPLRAKDGLPLDLVFASDREGNYQIFGSDRKGRHVRRLVQNLCTELAPRWSPARNRIALISDREGPFKVFIMNPATDDIRAVPDSTVRESKDGSPFDWAPDGSEIVFIRPDRSHLDIADLRTPQIRTVYEGKTNPRYSCFVNVSWDKAGNRILLSAINADSADLAALYAIDPQTGAVQPLAEGVNAYFNQAVASPDGREIALVWNPNGEGAYRNLYFMDSAKPEARKAVTTWRKIDSLPRWSGDGKDLVFSSGTWQKKQILIRDSASGEFQEVTNGAFDDIQPDLR